MGTRIETVSYTSPLGREVPSYLARPDDDHRHPAILMCYELWGMSEVNGGGPHMRDIAARFANLGYVALIPDIYVASGQAPRLEGGAIIGGPSDDDADIDLCAGVDWLKKQPFVLTDEIGAIGWCGGGRHALFLAARCPDLKAAASFYGRPLNRALSERQPVSPIDLVDQMNCPVFGAYGQADQGIPVDIVRQLEDKLEQQGKAHEIHIYPGAGHAFMNDQRDSYHAQSANESWQAVVQFFGRHLAMPALV